MESKYSEEHYPIEDLLGLHIFSDLIMKSISTLLLYSMKAFEVSFTYVNIQISLPFQQK